MPWQVGHDLGCLCELLDGHARATLQQLITAGATASEAGSLPPVVQVDIKRVQ